MPQPPYMPLRRRWFRMSRGRALSVTGHALEPEAHRRRGIVEIAEVTDSFGLRVPCDGFSHPNAVAGAVAMYRVQSQHFINPTLQDPPLTVADM